MKVYVALASTGMMISKEGSFPSRETEMAIANSNYTYDISLNSIAIFSIFFLF